VVTISRNVDKLRRISDEEMLEGKKKLHPPEQYSESKHIATWRHLSKSTLEFLTGSTHWPQ
jgi:hypothetical protein